MAYKLRQLSIVTLAHRSKKVSYTTLMQELDLSNVRELEDIVIETIYAGLVDGRLDQANGVLKVNSAVARDVRQDEVAGMIEKLRNWGANVETLITALETNMGRVHAAREEETKLRADVTKAMEDAKSNRAPGAPGGKKDSQKRGASGTASSSSASSSMV